MFDNTQNPEASREIPRFSHLDGRGENNSNTEQNGSKMPTFAELIGVLPKKDLPKKGDQQKKKPQKENPEPKESTQTKPEVSPFQNEKTRELSPEFLKLIKVAQEMEKNKTLIDFPVNAKDNEDKTLHLKAQFAGLTLINQNTEQQIQNGENPQLKKLDPEEVSVLPRTLKDPKFPPHNLLVTFKVPSSPNMRQDQVSDLEITVPLMEFLSQDIHVFLSRFYNHVLYAAAQHRQQTDRAAKEKSSQAEVKQPITASSSTQPEKDKTPSYLHLADAGSPTMPLANTKAGKIGYFNTPGALHGQINLAALEKMSVIPLEKTESAG